MTDEEQVQQPDKPIEHLELSGTPSQVLEMLLAIMARDWEYTVTENGDGTYTHH